MDINQFTHFNSGEVLDPVRGYPERDIDWFEKNILPDIKTLIENKAISNGRLIDIGCAKGYFTAQYANLFTEVIGIDFAEKRIEEANAHHQIPNLFFRTLDISLPLPEFVERSSFNTAITSAVIQHINPQSRYQVFENIHRMLTPGGKLVLYEAFQETQRNRGFSTSAHPWNGNIELLDLKEMLGYPFFGPGTIEYIANSGGDFHIYRVILTALAR